MFDKDRKMATNHHNLLIVRVFENSKTIFSRLSVG